MTYSALVASAALHGLALIAANANALRAPEPALPRDAWSAHSVEVGTLIDSSRVVQSPSVEGSRPSQSNDATKAQAAVAAANVDEAGKRQHERNVIDASKEGAELQRRPAAVSTPARSTGKASSRRPASESATTSAAPSAAAAAAPETDSGSHGAQGLPPGVRHLGKAFARALPAANYADATWARLPLGRVGRVAVRLRVGESGALEDVQLEESDAGAAVLERLVERTVLLLRAGTFSLDPRKLQSGTERLSLEVQVTQRPANPDTSALPQHLYAQGHEAPTAERPGYARVTLNSGLTLDVTLRLEPNGLPTR